MNPRHKIFEDTQKIATEVFHGDLNHHDQLSLIIRKHGNDTRLINFFNKVSYTGKSSAFVFVGHGNKEATTWLFAFLPILISGALLFLVYPTNDHYIDFALSLTILTFILVSVYKIKNITSGITSMDNIEKHE